MIHHRLISIAALIGSASAQTTLVAPSELCSDVRHGGVYHLASGMLSPAPPQGALFATPGTVYSNSCLPAPGQNITFAQALNAWIWLDDGRAPSTTSPVPAIGTFDRYRITSFEFGYCTKELDPGLGGPGATVHVRIFEDYDECSATPGSTPVFDATLNNLPASQTQGVTACVLLTVDLAGGFEFEMQADADGHFDGNATLDRFGIALTMPNQTGTQLGQVGGFILAGQSPASNTCSVGDETYWGNAGAAAGDGLDDGPGLMLDNAGAQTQCLQSLAGYPGVYLRLIGDLDDCNLNAQPDLFDIASGASQDTNTNDVPDECELVIITPFCTSSSTTHGCHPSITGTGVPSASQPTGFTIAVANVEGLKSGLIFYGIDNTGWTPPPWASGSTSFLCVKPPTQRTPAQNSGGGANLCNGALSIDWNAYRANNPSALGSPFAIGQHIFSQGWFRDPAAPKTTNLSNALEFQVSP